MSRSTLVKVSQIRCNFSDIYKCVAMQRRLLASNLPRCALLQLKQNHRAESCVHLQRYRDVCTPQEPGRKCCCVLFTAQFTTCRKVRREKHEMHMQKMAAATLQTCPQQQPAPQCFSADRAVTRSLSVTARSGTSSLFCRHSEGRRWLPQTSRQRCVP